jgi:hypothetical protein
MARPSDVKKWAINQAKYMSKHAKFDTEKRRWFNIFLVLTGQLNIEIKDDQPTRAGNLPSQPSLDDKAAKMLQQINGGGDVSNSQPASS